MSEAETVYTRYSPAVQRQFQDAWRRCEALAIQVATESAPRKKPKSFEVHHAIEHARKTFLASLAKGYPADLCERGVKALYSGYA